MTTSCEYSESIVVYSLKFYHSQGKKCVSLKKEIVLVTNHKKPDHATFCFISHASQIIIYTLDNSKVVAHTSTYLTYMKVCIKTSKITKKKNLNYSLFISLKKGNNSCEKPQKVHQELALIFFSFFFFIKKLGVVGFS